MRLELHITAAPPPPLQYVTGMKIEPDPDNAWHSDRVTLLPPEPDPTVVKVSTDSGMTAHDVSALLRSVADSLSPRDLGEPS